MLSTTNVTTAEGSVCVCVRQRNTSQSHRSWWCHMTFPEGLGFVHVTAPLIRVMHLWLNKTSLLCFLHGQRRRLCSCFGLGVTLMVAVNNVITWWIIISSSLSSEWPVDRGAAHHRKSGSVFPAWKGVFEPIPSILFILYLVVAWHNMLHYNRTIQTAS